MLHVIWQSGPPLDFVQGPPLVATTQVKENIFDVKYTCTYITKEMIDIVLTSMVQAALFFITFQTQDNGSKS
jgi:hypothetical protein